MCGAALGMVCNGMYAFWGPFWCMIVVGIWAARGLDPDSGPVDHAVVMVIGIALVGNLNPLNLFKKKEA